MRHHGRLPTINEKYKRQYQGESMVIKMEGGGQNEIKSGEQNKIYEYNRKKMCERTPFG